MDKPAGDAAAAFEAMLALDHALLRLPFEQLTKVRPALAASFHHVRG